MQVGEEAKDEVRDGSHGRELREEPRWAPAKPVPTENGVAAWMAACTAACTAAWTMARTAACTAAETREK